MKPLIIYVDDEPHNLTVFEAALPADWEILTFDNPLSALDALNGKTPSVVFSDQRMPGMNGVSFLEIVRKTTPFAKRALVTGYSDEDLVVESVRKAQVHDYIRKPWDVDDLLHRVQKLVDTFNLEAELRTKSELLEKQNEELKKISVELQKSEEREKSLRIELQSWAPPFVLETIQTDKLSFPVRKSLALIVFDIVNSSQLHDIVVDDQPIRSTVVKGFAESVIKFGGWRESSAGDSAYAHFGLFENNGNPYEAAYAVANEFRLFLSHLNRKHGTAVECGIGLHVAPETLVNIEEAKILGVRGLISQKTLTTASPHIDLVHRIEKLTHLLPGSNIIMSEEFNRKLERPVDGLIQLGDISLKGQPKACPLLLKPSHLATQDMIQEFVAQLQEKSPPIRNAA